MVDIGRAKRAMACRIAIYGDSVMSEMPAPRCFPRVKGPTLVAVQYAQPNRIRRMKENPMKPIRTIFAVLAITSALALAGQAYGQSAPLPYTLQADPQVPDTTTRQQQDDVMNLLTAHLGLWLSRDPNTYPYERLLTEDTVFEYPYADEQSERRIEGRTAVADALRKLAAVTGERSYGDIKLFQTPHPDVFFVEYKATARAPGTQQPYEQRYLARITVKEGKIANYYELWDRDTAASLQATTAHN